MLLAADGEQDWEKGNSLPIAPLTILDSGTFTTSEGAATVPQQVKLVYRIQGQGDIDDVIQKLCNTRFKYFVLYLF